MDFSGICEAFDKVAKKQSTVHATTNQVIDRLVEQLLQAKQSLRVNSFPQDLTLGQRNGPALTNVDSQLAELKPLAEISSVQKDLNLALAKCGKCIEKNFFTDISQACREVKFDDTILNEVIAQHFYREGQFEIGDCFVKEAGVDLADSLKAPFSEMYEILEHIKCRNLEPALIWARNHHDQLSKNCSGSFEFNLHRLHYINLLQKLGQQAAVSYAKSNFEPFATSHMVEIQRLMGCLLWVGRLESSPYSDLLATAHWESVAHEFAHECCNLLGQAYESPLHVTITAGGFALPTLLKLATVMANRHLEWQTMQHLPVEIELGKQFQYHSIFACPVSREQSSAENPPMLMPCGHVLCKQSILKLGKGNSRSFKCPYCPAESTAVNCKVIHF